jgi:hypothetical protein
MRQSEILRFKMLAWSGADDPDRTDDLRFTIPGRAFLQVVDLFNKNQLFRESIYVLELIRVEQK